MSYFENFALIRYNNAVTIDITQRTTILNQVFGDNYSFYPYHVKNGMRAEQVAEKYYGDANLVWLVYFSNNIIDPYHQWVMDEQTFKAFIEQKYGSIPEAISQIVKWRVNWFEDNTILTPTQYTALDSNLKKYWVPNFDNYGYPASYVRKEMDFASNAVDEDGNVTLSVPEGEEDYWVALNAFDYEEEENAKKSHIRLLDNRLAQTAVLNLRDLLRV